MKAHERGRELGRKRFVIFRPGALGDTLAAVPVIWAIRARYPSARIAYLSERHPHPSVVTSKEALELVPEVDEVHLYDPASSGRDRLREVRRALTPRSGDTLLYLCYARGSAREVLRDWGFFQLAGFRRLAGFWAALGDALRRQAREPGESEYARLFRVLRSSGMRLDEAVPGRLRVDEAWAREFWDRSGLRDFHVVAVCPGSKMQSKRWPAERYAEAISRLGEEHPSLAFAIIGDARDRPVADSILRKAKERMASAVGASLLQTSSLLARSCLYLGNDTGPMHMAALHGVPCVAVFSERDRKGKWHPFGKGHSVMRAEVPCVGCMLRECFAVPPVCLSAIGVEEVVAAVRSSLQGRSPRSTARKD